MRRRAYRTRNEARADVFDYIEVFCNRYRRQGHVGGIAPLAFEETASKNAT